MASPEHLHILKQGAVIWNQWQRRNPQVRADLQEADLSGVSLSSYILSNSNLARANLAGAPLTNSNLTNVDLSNADLSSVFARWSNFFGADLSNAKLSNSNLAGANLTGANLRSANLVNSNLTGANLAGADLSNADFSQANLAGANLSNARLAGANMFKSKLWNTIFAQIDLTNTRGLGTIEHRGPSNVDLKSVHLPDGEERINFLRGVGYSEIVIDNYISLFANFRPYSYFISYSFHDDAFAQRLYKDLQNAGIRCWFTIHDLQPDPSLLHGVYNPVQSHEKLLVILSEDAINSTWIEREVENVFHLDGSHRQNSLFLVRLDEAIFNSQSPWIVRLRQHYIEDFTQWQDELAYSEALIKLLYHLTAENYSASEE